MREDVVKVINLRQKKIGDWSQY